VIISNQRGSIHITDAAKIVCGYGGANFVGQLNPLSLCDIFGAILAPSVDQRLFQFGRIENEIGKRAGHTSRRDEYVLGRKGRVSAIDMVIKDFAQLSQSFGDAQRPTARLPLALK
jgi:hypothetical protein